MVKHLALPVNIFPDKIVASVQLSAVSLQQKQRVKHS
jgi:hypothetical protein